MQSLGIFFFGSLSSFDGSVRNKFKHIGTAENYFKSMEETHRRQISRRLRQISSRS